MTGCRRGGMPQEPEKILPKISKLESSIGSDKVLSDDADGGT